MKEAVLKLKFQHGSLFILFLNHVDKIAVNPVVIRQFWVKSGHQEFPLSRNNSFAVHTGQNLYARAGAFDEAPSNLPMVVLSPPGMPSQPSCIISAASAHVAMPPAAKFTTGILPSFFVSHTNSSGAAILR